jgi:hypothetical protein
MEAIYAAAKERSPPQTKSHFQEDVPSHNALMKQFQFRSVKGKTNYYKEAATPLTFRGNATIKQFAKEGSIDPSVLEYMDLPDNVLQERLQNGAGALLAYDFASERSSAIYATLDRKARFLTHYANTKDLLLAGPPHANDHGIDPERAAAWVAAQHTAERRRLAQLVVNVLRYISHAELIAGIQHCIEELETQYNRDLPVIFLVGEPKKSNYYVSLLFAHFWLERGNPIDFVIPSLYKSATLHLAGNIFDIDDMGYSGSQTTGSMNAFLSGFAYSLIRIMYERIPDPAILSFMPLFLIEYILGQLGLQYYLVRIFSSTDSLAMWKDQVKMPYRLVTHEVLPTLREQVGDRNANRINALFNFAAGTMAVYFDHKVADGVSTLLVPIAFGIVPGKKVMIDEYDMNVALGPENRRNISFAEGGDTPTFLPFIKNCIRDLTVDDIDGDYENDDVRCPYAWYKQIDYNKGIYRGRGGSRRQRKGRRVATKTRRHRRS